MTGKTGVGKSTLINSIFINQFSVSCHAETGFGIPVTQNIREYRGLPPLTIAVDTPGLELEGYSKKLKEVHDYVLKKQKIQF